MQKGAKVARSKPTIQDVARRCGVAPITVSRVINNSGYVAAEVRERVQQAIRDLGYVPNTLARSLRSSRTNTIALVLTDLTNPFFTTVVRGAEDAASDQGYMLIIANTDEHEDKEHRYVQMLLQHRVDGILLVPARGAAESARLIQQQQTPLVIMDRRAVGTRADSVCGDSVGGARQLGELVASLGHNHVAVLAGPEGVSTSDDRILGFQQGLTSLRPSATCRIYHGNFNQDSGRQLTRQALAANPRPTALFGANNFMTIGALRGLRDANVSVPEDVTLVGFDDLPDSIVTFPFLTVAAQPAYEMGRRSVELLLERIKSGITNPDPTTELLLPVELIVRGSSGPAPQAQISSQ